MCTMVNKTLFLTIIMLALASFVCAAAGGILEEGQTGTYTVDGKEFNISVEYIESDRCRILVNDEISGSLEEGTMYIYNNIAAVKILDITDSNLAGDVGTVEFNISYNKDLNCIGDCGPTYYPVENTLRVEAGEEYGFFYFEPVSRNLRPIYQWFLDDVQVESADPFTYVDTLDEAGNHTVTVSAFDKWTGQTVLTHSWTLEVYEPSTNPVLEVPPELIIEGNKGDTKTKSFTIRNTGSVSLSMLNITTDISSRYNPVISYSGNTLAANSTKSVTLRITVPESEDSGDKQIGNILIRTDKLNESVPVNLVVESKISVEADKSRIKTAPGANITVGFDVQSFDDLEDVKVTGVIRGIDVEDDDLEEETDTFVLNSRKKAMSLSFDIPLTAKKGEYTLELTAEGEDEDGATHTAKDSLVIVVEKDAHEVIITKAIVSQSCRESILRLELFNIGEEDEDLTLKVYHDGAVLTQKDFELYADSEEDSRYSNSFVYDYVAGNIDVRVYNDEDLMASKIVNAPAQECSFEAEESEDEFEAFEEVELDSAADAEEIVDVNTVKKSFTDSNLYVALLALGFVALAVLLVFAVRHVSNK